MCDCNKLLLGLILIFLFSCLAVETQCQRNTTEVKLYEAKLQQYFERNPPVSKHTSDSTYLHPSLFPNIGPYIKFSDFDSENPVTIPKELSSSLKWLQGNTVRHGGFQCEFIANKTGFESNSDNEWIGYWHGARVDSHIPNPTVARAAPYQKFNYFLKVNQLGEKDLQNRNIKRFLKLFGREEFNFLSESFNLPEEFEDFKKAYDHYPNKLWIFKPSLGSHSQGIKLIDHWSEVELTKSDAERVVIQKYLDRPYIFLGRKIELRNYVLITSFNPLRAYVYKEAITRISYKNYTSNPAFKSDPCIHFRVVEPQLECPDSFPPLELDNNNFEMLHSLTMKELQSEGVNIKKLEKNMEDAIVKSLLTIDRLSDDSTRQSFLNRYNQFHLLAFDFLLDADCKPWIIDINKCPGMIVSELISDEFTRLKFQLVRDVLDLVGYQLPPMLTKEAIGTLARDPRNIFDEEPLTFNSKLYSFDLTKEDALKQKRVVDQWRASHRTLLPNILDGLSADDLKQLVVAEDELNRAQTKKSFKRIFPRSNTQKYLKYVASHPYYYLLLGAWEAECSARGGRTPGIALLRNLTKLGIHLNQ